MSVRMHLALRASLQARQGTRVELIAMDNTVYISSTAGTRIECQMSLERAGRAVLNRRRTWEEDLGNTARM